MKTKAFVCNAKAFVNLIELIGVSYVHSGVRGGAIGLGGI